MYTLPRGATQGPVRWYTIRLRYRMRFAPGTGRGLAWVTAAVNGATTAQIEYATARTGRTLRFRRTSVDLVNGQLERAAAGSVDVVEFRNYLPFAGVRGARNTLVLRVETAGKTRVERVEVLPGTAIAATSRTPYPLSLRAELLGDERPRAGERFRVGVTLRNRTGEPVRDVAVVAQLDRRALRVVGRPRVVVGRLTAPARVVFTFDALAVGAQTIELLGESSRNDPGVTVRVTVRERRRSAASVLPWEAVLAAAGLLAGGGALLVHGRRGPRAP